MNKRTAWDVIRTVRSEKTGRVQHHLSTDGMRHRSHGAAAAHQLRLDWVAHPFGPNQPRTLQEWADRIEQLKAQHGPESLLVIDSGYEDHEIDIYTPTRPDADPDDIA